MVFNQVLTRFLNLSDSSNPPRHILRPVAVAIEFLGSWPVKGKDLAVFALKGSLFQREFSEGLTFFEALSNGFLFSVLFEPYVDLSEGFLKGFFF